MGTGTGIALGRYELLRKLRVLGPVEHYLALQRSVGGVERLVVVKRISATVAQDRRLVEELLEEARIAGQVAHVNVVQVLDVGEDDEGCYLAMEHVHGESLASVLAALRRIGSVHIGIQVCSALAHAHEHKDMSGEKASVVHGALSPDNVFVTFAGEVKIADFGLLASKKGADVAASIPYPAPEQVRGEQADALTDVYAIGMLLLELTTGQAPRQRPPEFGAGYPPKLAAILLQAAARRRAHRQTTASELLEQLETFAKSSRLRTSPVTFSAFLHKLFPDGEGRLLRERREARLQRAARAEEPTLPDPPPSSAPPPPGGVAHEVPPPRLMDFDATAGLAELRRLTTAPPSARTDWPKVVDAKRGATVGIALGTGLLVGLVVGSVKHTTSAAGAPNPAPSSVTMPLVEKELGSVDVDSVPAGANVLVEGDLMADPTPSVIRRLPYGRPVHVRVTHPGFDPFEAEVILAPERPSQHLAALLSPSTLTLHVTIDANDPALWIDGKYTSARVVSGLAVAEDHKVAVSAPGRIGKIVVFRSEQGGDKQLDLKLEPARLHR